MSNSSHLRDGWSTVSTLSSLSPSSLLLTSPLPLTQISSLSSSSSPSLSASLSSVNVTEETFTLWEDKLTTSIPSELTAYVILIVVFFLPLSLFIIIGNSLVIIAVHNSFHLRQRVVYYVVASMAVTDLIVGFSIVPIYYTAIFVEELKGHFYACMSAVAFLFSSCSISILHVLVIAADRYIAVFYSLEYPRIVTQRRVFSIISAIWLLVVFFHSLPYMGWNRQNPQLPLQYCFTDQVYTPAFLSFQFCLTFVAPLVIMSVIYVRIIMAARLQARRVDAQQEFVSNISSQVPPVTRNESTSPQLIPARPAPKRVRGPTVAELKATKTSAIVLGSFLVCWLPAYCVHIAFTFINSGQSEPLHTEPIAIIQASSSLLPFISSAANPVIYAFRYADFRRSFRDTLRCAFCRRTNMPNA